jgi:hypothetical protein
MVLYVDHWYIQGGGNWQVFGFIKKKKPSYGIGKKCVYTYFSPSSTHLYDFVVLTSLTHPRKILLVVLQIGKAKDLSAPLRVCLEASYTPDL